MCRPRLAKIVRDIREEDGVGSRRRPRRTAVYLAFLQSPWGALRSAWVLQKNAACVDRGQGALSRIIASAAGVDATARENGMDAANGSWWPFLCHFNFMQASPWISTLNSSASSPLRHACFSERGPCALPTLAACCCNSEKGCVEHCALAVGALAWNCRVV
jgi:hypothetical protein